MATFGQNRYTDFNTYLRNRFGDRVQKITVDAGLDCPNRDGTLSTGGCVYCNARGSGTGAMQQGLSVTEQIEGAKKWMIRRYKAKYFLAYFQSFTNTYAPTETLRSLYDEALAVEGVVGMSVGTRPDCVTGETLSLLEGYARKAMVWVEYGLQSANDETLSRINRGHDVDCFSRTVKATQNRGILICAHIILGLPGESRAEIMKTADTVAQLGVDGIKIHLLYVVKDTPMETLYRTGKYSCLEQDEYVGLVCDVLERLPESVIIHRLTGDPHPDELVAPSWALDRNTTFNKIRHTLESRGSRQGKHAAYS